MVAAEDKIRLALHNQDKERARIRLDSIMRQIEEADKKPVVEVLITSPVVRV